jgi:hypothetical protein
MNSLFVSFFVMNCGELCHHQQVIYRSFANGFRRGLMFRHQRDVVLPDITSIRRWGLVLETRLTDVGLRWILMYFDIQGAPVETDQRIWGGR